MRRNLITVCQIAVVITVLSAILGNAYPAGLLTGMTPSSYSLPSGWTLKRATDFESGCNATYENCGIGQSTVGAGSQAHSGVNTVHGIYSKDGDQVAVVLYPGTYTEAYVSYYQYIDSGALFTDEFYIADWMKRTPSDDLAQELILDYIWCGINSPNNTGCKLDIQAGGNAGYSLIGTYNLQTDIKNMPLGQWIQWEIHYRPNTSTGGVPNNDGFMRVYMTPSVTVGVHTAGVTETWMNVNNFNMNGTQDMNNLYLYLGGTATRLVWSQQDPNVVGSSACVFPAQCGSVSDACRNYTGLPILFASPACGPAQPSFNRYIDDVLLMTTGGTTPQPPVVTPPYFYGANPAEGATGVPTTNRDTIFHIAKGDYNVNSSSIVAVINGVTKTTGTTPPLVITGTSADYTVTYTHDSSRYPGQIVPVVVNASDVNGNAMPTKSYSYQMAQSANSYSTNFNTTENPISESGNWTMHGFTTGVDWSDVKTASGNATGTGTQDGYTPSNFIYNDAIALLGGTWGADQTASAVVHIANQTDGGVSGFGSNAYNDCNKEIELYLRGTVTSHNVSLYTVTFSSRLGVYSYYETGYWNGPRGYNGMPNPEGSGYMLHHVNGDGSQAAAGAYELHDGDTVSASITGNIIRAYINGNLIDTVDVRYNENSVSIPVITSGAPGIGFFSGTGCTGQSHNDDFGLTSYTVSTTGIGTLPINIDTTTLANATQGSPYSATISTSGGTTPYTYSLLSGSLPTGMAVPSTGTGSWGTPSADPVGSPPSTYQVFNFTVKVLDAVGNTDNQAYTILYYPKVPGGSGTLSVAGLDTYINGSCCTTTNFDTNAALRVYQSPAGVPVEKILLDFDISSLPGTAVIDNAYLEMILGNPPNATGTSGGTDPMLVYVYRTTPFTASTVTWNTYSPTLVTLGGAYVPLTAGTKISWPVTLGARWAKENVSHLYLELNGANLGSDTTNRRFVSTAGGTGPTLVVNYTVYPSGEPPSLSAPGKLRVSHFTGTWH